MLGEVEEYFIEMLTPGDTFVFAGEVLRYEAIVEDQVYVSRAASEDPKVPSYEGGKFPLSTYLADSEVRKDIDQHILVPVQLARDAVGRVRAARCSSAAPAAAASMPGSG